MSVCVCVCVCLSMSVCVCVCVSVCACVCDCVSRTSIAPRFKGSQLFTPSQQGTNSIDAIARFSSQSVAAAVM